jgi:hypothetical protein
MSTVAPARPRAVASSHSAAAALLALALASCQTPRYVDSPPYAKPRQEILPTVLEVLEREGFRVKSLAEGRTIDAQKVRLSPFNREGKRWQASVVLDESPDGTLVRVMIRSEINYNLTNPMDERQADWGSEEFDADMESLLLFKINMKLNPTRLPPSERRDRSPLR